MVDALQEALTKWGKAEMFTRDQGSQLTRHALLHPLIDKEVKVSMDGKGRSLDTMFIERLYLRAN